MANVNIEKVIEEWKIDSNIDSTDIVRELLKTSNLHAKYLEYFIFFKAKAAHIEKEMNKMAWKKRVYFRGEMEKHELDSRGWSQWQGLKPSASELNSLLEMDRDMNEYKERLSAAKASVQVTEYIMKQISQRDFTLKSVVDYNKFLSGN